MCVVCGCAAHIPDPHPAAQDAPAPASHRHANPSPAHPRVPGLNATRTLKMEADVLGANQRLADRNRAHFQAHGVRALNLVSSPGAGKTTLLCATLRVLRQRLPHLPLAVIEGDQQTRLDAERIEATGVPVIQINTGQGCHLDAHMVGDAFARLDLHAHAHTNSPTTHRPAPMPAQARSPRYTPVAATPRVPETQPPLGALLFIENVGNLVCPALWDLGEAAKVLILSVTEGEDKPLKYPDMFAAASLLLINKTDLLPFVDFDMARCITHARHVNPDITVLQISATLGTGLQDWLNWLLQQPDQNQPAATPSAPPLSAPPPNAPNNEAALRQRIALLEAQLAALQVSAPPAP